MVGGDETASGDPLEDETLDRPMRKLRAAVGGRPGLSEMLIAGFSNIPSEQAIAGHRADSLSVRNVLRYGTPLPPKFHEEMRVGSFNVVCVLTPSLFRINRIGIACPAFIVTSSATDA